MISGCQLARCRSPISKKKKEKTKLRISLQEETFVILFLLERELSDEMDTKAVIGTFEQSSREHKRLLLTSSTSIIFWGKKTLIFLDDVFD